jgi:hypothetical protein
MLNKYFSLTSKLEEENMLLPDFDMKTNNVINIFIINRVSKRRNTVASLI